MIAVSAPHRADALAACKDAIDQLKERAPLWKKEVYAGGEEWIGQRLMSSDYRDYEPIHPRGRDWRGIFRRLFGPLVAGAIALAKFSFVLIKFAGIFISVGLYTLFFGWKFAVGFVLLILLHEIGALHRGEARGAESEAARVHPVPRRVRPVHARESLADGAGRARRADRRRARVARLFPDRRSRRTRTCSARSAYTGFFLNLINLIPVGILDGGAIWRSAQVAAARRRPREGRDRVRALRRDGGRARRSG